MDHDRAIFSVIGDWDGNGGVSLQLSTKLIFENN